MTETKQQITPGVQIPAHQIRMGLDRLIEEGKLDQGGADAVFWFYSYAQDKNMTLRGLGEKIGYNASAVHSILHCNYGASLDNVIAAINRLRLKEEAAAKNKAIGFVETETWRTISAACLSALQDGMTAFIYGASQLGKTTCLLEFQRTHNHGQTKYLRMGAAWSKPRFVRELAKVCRCFAKKQTTADLEERINGALNDRMLLIIDEFHLVTRTSSRRKTEEVLEYIREVFDRTKVGLVLSATRVGVAELEEGVYKMLFDQTDRRGIAKVVLPDMVRVKDINTFARSFDLPIPAGETLSEIKRLLKTRGLGVFIKYLQKAYQLARAKKTPLTWDIFERVHEGYVALANPVDEY